MNDTETLREILRFVSVSLEVAERFYDAPTVHALTEVINIIERRHGGDVESDPRL